MPESSTTSAIRNVRSTLLVSSRAALQELGLLERYEANLDAVTRETLRGTVAGTWLPAELVMAHYAACDALDLPRTTQQALGRRNGDRLRGTLLGTIAKVARSTGTTPATTVEQMPRFWGRIFDGGAFQPEKRGPKDVRLLVSAAPVLQSTYFRNGLVGTAESILSLVASRLYVRVESFDARAGTAVYLVQWA